MHTDDKKNDILGAEHSITFTELWKRFELNLHYNRSNSFLFFNATKIYQFKVKVEDSEL